MFAIPSGLANLATVQVNLMLRHRVTADECEVRYKWNYSLVTVEQKNQPIDDKHIENIFK